MKPQHIARLEAHLEGFVEGTFAALFGRTLRAHDIALQLARAMEDSLHASTGDDPRPIAPDHYRVYTAPAAHQALLEKYGPLQDALAVHLVELASLSGYRLLLSPTLKFLADPQLDANHIQVSASHTRASDNSTAVLEQVLVPPMVRPPNPQIVVDGQAIDLQGDIINIGRSRENHIVLDDPAVSRHHVQLRLRSGAYLIFDIQSQSGTFVNEVRVREHRLASGDIVRIGQTQLLYMQDEEPLNDPKNATQPINTDP